MLENESSIYINLHNRLKSEVHLTLDLKLLGFCSSALFFQIGTLVS